MWQDKFLAHLHPESIEEVAQVYPQCGMGHLPWAGALEQHGDRGGRGWVRGVIELGCTGCVRGLKSA